MLLLWVEDSFGHLYEIPSDEIVNTCIHAFEKLKQHLEVFIFNFFLNHNLCLCVTMLLYIPMDFGLRIHLSS